MRNTINSIPSFIANVGLVVGLIFVSQLASAQCGVSIMNTTNDTLDVACGSSVVLERDTLGAFALYNTFDDGTIGADWDGGSSAQLDNPCGASNSIYLWMGSQTAQPRSLTTIPLNLSCGGQICFEFRMAVQGQASPCEGPDEQDEGMALQYQLPGSTAWDTIFYFEPNDTGDSNALSPGSGDWTAWHQYCFQIPTVAQLPNVQLRWSQQDVTSNNFDHWGLDSISVELYCGNVTNIWSTGDTGQFVTTPDVTTPLDYSVTRYITTGLGTSDTCTDSVVVMPRNPIIPIEPSFEPFCKNSDAEVVVNYNNAQFIDSSATYTQEWIPNIFDVSDSSYGIVSNLTADTSVVFSYIHDTYPTCNLIDTIEILAGGVEIDQADFYPPTCYRDSLTRVEWSWINELNGPFFFVWQNGSSIVPPALDDTLMLEGEGDFELILNDGRCADTARFTVVFPDTLTTDISNIDTNICVESTTDQTFEASGGFAPYKYSYTNGVVRDTYALAAGRDTLIGMFAVDAQGCVSDTTYKLFIIPPPIKIEQYDTLVCPNIPFQVTAVASGGLGGPYSYVWQNGDQTATTTLIGKEGRDYSVTASDGCAKSAVMRPRIDIIETPRHTIVRSFYANKENRAESIPDTGYVEIANNDYTLDQYAPLELFFKPDPKLPGSSYEWDLWHNGSIADKEFGWPVIPDTIFTDVAFRYAKEEVYEVQLITTTREGCIDTAYATHILEFNENSNNVFSPNGDGINDYFFVPGSEALRDFKMQIYNRWGQLVFETTNGNLPENGGGWDGGDQPDGTYFYVVTAKRGNGADYVDKGTVTLFKN